MTTQPGRKKYQIYFAAGCLIIAVFQWISFAKPTIRLWPFHPIPPYKHFPEDFKKSQSIVFGVSAEIEASLSKLEGLDYQVLKQFYLALERSADSEEANDIARSLINYVNEESDGPEVERLRLYLQEWDLGAGEIISSNLEAEFIP